MMTVTANSKRHLKLGMNRYKRLSKTILMNETNSKTTKLGHVVEIGICRECDAESRAHFHTCQPSRIIRESPAYDTNLPVSRTGRFISRIKSSFELFCALV